MHARVVTCITHDAFDSPGCTRAESATTGRAFTASAGLAWSVTHNISHSLPAIVKARRWRRTCRALNGSACKRAKYARRSVYVYG